MVQIHNPHRAQHHGAIWDLGDSGSHCFSEFALSINRSPGGCVNWRPEGDFSAEPVVDDSVLFQASSGGRHWDSPTHIDAAGEIPNRFKGYRIETGGETVATGDRASPQVWLEREDKTAFGFACRHYWQNFPKCIEVRKGVVKLGLFPTQHGADYELQGGERKQHEIVFSFDSKNASPVLW